MTSRYSASFPKDLLARVLEAPDDDAPRMVLAETLRSKGDPRSALITLQCNLAADAALPVEKRMAGDERLALEENAVALLQTHGQRWQAEAGLGADPACVCRFERGFIEHVEVASHFAEIGDGWDYSPIKYVRSEEAISSRSSSAFLSLTEFNR